MRFALFSHAGVLLAYGAAQGYLAQREAPEAVVHLAQAACAYRRCLCRGVLCQSCKLAGAQASGRSQCTPAMASQVVLSHRVQTFGYEPGGWQAQIVQWPWQRAAHPGLAMGPATNHRHPLDG